jgi:hypothetical protein
MMRGRMHASETSDPVVAGNRFSISWIFDVTVKGQGRTKMEEICVYDVQETERYNPNQFSPPTKFKSKSNSHRI